uniref:NADP-dependent oxidoreductase domain-containing protein n=1 Tax=Pyramimonas obovata TaxID=1411642 RepID=A0A7S0WSD9_9CHLO|mmetsp:Transcript_3667/g.7586  ORF Transcript_3667/g.7586 Transcript_3667/m.7586 type:complete len:328 (+) Transcript_3667:79-1062(+)
MADRNGLFTLNNGLKMPAVGLGTWKSKPGEVQAAVEHALRVGYRHIDCAPVYGNQNEVGAAFATVFGEGAIKRDEVWITSKIFPKVKAEEYEAQCREILSELGVEQLDLCLLHWPTIEHSTLLEMWAAMEGLLSKGLTKTIGVSNFSVEKLNQILPSAKVVPAVNQVELHPTWHQRDLRAFCLDKGIHLSAYCPLGSPDQWAADGLNRKCTGVPPLADERVKEVATRVGKTPAQVLLRWGVQMDSSVLPKSVTPNRIEENLKVTDGWELSQEDMAALSDWTPQYRLLHGAFHTGPSKAYKTLRDLWDEDTSYLEGRDFEIPPGFKLQ